MYLILLCNTKLLTPYFLNSIYIPAGDRGSTAVKVLRYKSEGHWFDSSSCHWNFSLT